MALLDELLGTEDPAPIRDGLVDSLTSLLYELEFRGEYALAQADAARATEGYLTSMGGEDRMRPRAIGEQDEPYRSRLFSTPETVTERAIVTGVNALLASFTRTQCQLVDTVLDRWFIGDDDPNRTWHSFIDAPPEYPDRLYSGQEDSWGGVSRPNSDPGGARVFDNEVGRQFLLLLPDVTGLPARAFVITHRDDLAPGTVSEMGFFVGNTTSADVASFPALNNMDAQALYHAIENFVNSVVGQSIRWSFIAELEAK